MDNFDLVNFDEGGGLPPSGSDEETPIPFDDSDSMPAPASGPAPASVSRKPLDLGAGKPSAAPAAQPVRTPPKPAVKPVPKPVAVSSAPRPAKAGAPVEAGHERITGVKTFFAKLHHGSLKFIDEQVVEWLKDHPEVVIKKTNVVVGEVQAKKTEPNVIMTVWY